MEKERDVAEGEMQSGQRNALAEPAACATDNIYMYIYVKSDADNQSCHTHTHARLNYVLMKEANMNTSGSCNLQAMASGLVVW